MIVGEEQPTSGIIRIGDTVKLGYMNQSRDALDPEKNIWEVILKVIVAAITAALTAITTTSCMGHGPF